MKSSPSIELYKKNYPNCQESNIFKKKENYKVQHRHVRQMQTTKGIFLERNYLNIVKQTTIYQQSSKEGKKTAQMSYVTTPSRYRNIITHYAKYHQCIPTTVSFAL